MRRSIGLAAVAVMLVFGSASSGQTAKNAGFEKLKVLAGTWEGTMGEGGEQFTTTYRVVSNGSALEETINGPHDANMVTLYTPDGGKLAMTHYCAAGNQPRMETKPVAADQKEFDFNFIGATNLASASAGHMHHLKITIEDENHITQAWTWSENGKEKIEAFHLTRKS